MQSGDEPPAPLLGYTGLAIGIAFLHVCVHWSLYSWAIFSFYAAPQIAEPDEGIFDIAFGVVYGIVSAPLGFLLLLPPSTFGNPDDPWWGDDANLLVMVWMANSLVWGVGGTVLFRACQYISSRGRQTRRHSAPPPPGVAG